MYANAVPTTPYPQSTPPQVSTLVEFNTEITVATKDIDNLRQQARAIADSVFGVVPQAAEAMGTTGGGQYNGSVVSAVPPKASSVRASIADLHAAVNRLRTEIERLSCI